MDKLKLIKETAEDALIYNTDALPEQRLAYVLDALRDIVDLCVPEAPPVVALAQEQQV